MQPLLLTARRRWPVIHEAVAEMPPGSSTRQAGLLSPWPIDAAEVLCVGSELLLGSIPNSNGRWLAEQLSLLGISHYRQAVVGDNPSRLEAMVRESAGRCRFLITTGGLGPTPDDLTTETLAITFGEPLEECAGLWTAIQDQLRSVGRSPGTILRRQAFLPKGAMPLPNPVGSAPGIIWSPDPGRVIFPVVPGFTVLTFPGVPAEMQAMWRETAAPWLARQSGVSGVMRHRVLRFSGVSESMLADRVGDLLSQRNPTVAPYASLGEVVLRLTARADSVVAADAALQPLEAKIRKRTGGWCFGVDDDTLASAVLALLRSRGETLAVAESCTGGGLGAALAVVPGASDVFVGGLIAYANTIKREWLGVDASLLDAYGAVSDPVAAAMASGLRERMDCDWALSVSGVAGPGGGSSEKPVGLVHLGLAGREGAWAAPVRFSPRQGRLGIQALSISAALDRLRLHLLGLDGGPLPGPSLHPSRLKDP